MLFSLLQCPNLLVLLSLCRYKDLLEACKVSFPNSIPNYLSSKKALGVHYHHTKFHDQIQKEWVPVQKMVKHYLSKDTWRMVEICFITRVYLRCTNFRFQIQFRVIPVLRKVTLCLCTLFWYASLHALYLEGHKSLFKYPFGLFFGSLESS
ncbi:hypothetical protein KP509_02G049400 [Ceratopteris richardii]|uniref:Uncharacterized protein n=1 Tax=Ceratopteris richardii TaxID=49495 RepID=A0A8T2V971_CERRI|nr:hypothetical protein KP509_02G049400 [Ceratopteris richardii]